MKKEIPEEIIKIAENFVNKDPWSDIHAFIKRYQIECVANCIFQERERCAEIAEKYDHGVYASEAIRMQNKIIGNDYDKNEIIELKKTEKFDVDIIKSLIEEIVKKDQIKEFMGDDKNDGYGNEGFISRDGEFAKIARKALELIEK